MDKAEEAVEGQGSYPLTNEQKKRLICAVKAAYDVQRSFGWADEPFDVWRRGALADATQETSIRALRQRQYNTALKYFLELAVRGAAGCRRLWSMMGWLGFETAENGRAPLQVHVRRLPKSCAVCLFGFRAAYSDELPISCDAAHRMMPNTLVDIGKARAPFCPLVPDEGSGLLVDECPAAARMAAGEVLKR